MGLRRNIYDSERKQVIFTHQIAVIVRQDDSLSEYMKRVVSISLYLHYFSFRHENTFQS